jgi:hypothetical protein
MGKRKIRAFTREQVEALREAVQQTRSVRRKVARETREGTGCPLDAPVKPELAPTTSPAGAEPTVSLNDKTDGEGAPS